MIIILICIQFGIFNPNGNTDNEFILRTHTFEEIQGN